MSISRCRKATVSLPLQLASPQRRPHNITVCDHAAGDADDAADDDVGDG